MRKTSAAPLFALGMALLLTACPPPSPPSPEKSSVAVDRPIDVVADGLDFVIITVTVRDTAGKPVSGQSVTLSATGQQNAISSPARTDGDGVTTATLSSRVAESKTITATIAEGDLADHPTVAFRAGPPSAIKSTVSAQPASAVADGLASVAIDVVLRDANDNMVPGAQVQLSATGADSVLVQPGPTDLNGATSGALSSTRAETKRVTAVATLTGGTGVTLLQQPLVQFTPGPAARLAFAVPPSNAALGDAISPPVEVVVQDSNGNRASSSGAAVHLGFGTRPAPGATLGGTVDRPAAGGLAAFDDLTSDKAGSGATLVATSSGLVSATSGSFTITPGAGPRLSFVSQPQDASAGATLGLVQVVLQDANGNTDLAATGPVTVALVGAAGGTLSGATTVSASAGMATFANLSVDKAGAGYALVATSTGYAGATSRTFAVSVGAPYRLVILNQPGATRAGVAISPALQVAVQDSAGNLVSSDTRVVTMAFGFNAGPGTLSGTTSLAAAAGVAAFGDLSIDKAARGYTLMASASGVLPAVSGVFDVTPGPAMQLAFTVPPGTSTAGAPLAPGTVEVTALDALGNVATGTSANVTVALETNPAGGALLGTLTVPAVSGVARFNDLRLALAGAGYALSAVASGVPKVVSPPFNVVPAAADHLVFTVQPQSGTAGATLAPPIQVAIDDAFGNVVTADSRPVSVALQGGTAGAALSGTTTVSAASGVARFPDLSVNQGGTGYRLAASASGLTGAQSAPFDLIPSSVTCAQTVHYVTRTGVLDREADLTDAPIGAYVFAADGGSTYYPGTADGGTCLIPDVPQGRFLFRYGVNYVDTSARFIDLSLSLQGRPGKVRADAGTTLDVALSNLAPATRRDYLLAHSFDTELYYPILGAGVPVGSTAGSTSFYWDGTPLLDAAQGDAVTFTQLSAMNPPEFPMADGGIGPRFYRAATRFHQAAVTLQDGTTTSLDAGFVPVPQSPSTLGWKLSPSTPGSFWSFTSQVNPTAYPFNVSLYVGPLVDGSRGFYGITPRILWLSWALSGTEPDFSITATWGNPFPPQYDLSARAYGWFEVAHDVPMTGGGTATVFTDVSINVIDRLSGFPLASVQPAISPVTAPLVNGAGFFADRSGVGTAPVISWSPPAVGTPSHYFVEIGEVDPSAVPFSPTPIASVQTALTQVKLPPILTPGRYYVLTITAYQQPGHDTEHLPWETTWPAHSAAAVSGLLSP